jgi:hypothetical protein
MRRFAFVAFVWFTVSPAAYSCSCIGYERPCEKLVADAAFVGRVIETVPVKHLAERGAYTLGYSMRFAVDESLKGGLGTEVKIETGSGGGDCGTPLVPGGTFLIFASKAKDGQLWTGLCSGNQQLKNTAEDQILVTQLRNLINRGTVAIFGQLDQSEPVWKDDDVEEGAPRPIAGMRVLARSSIWTATTITDKSGKYEFDAIPSGNYTVVPDISPKLDFDHEYEDRYQADLSPGGCANIVFRVMPVTRIKGRVTRPPGVGSKLVEVEALPVGFANLNQFSGKWDIADEDGNFDLWPLPPGDYYVGVNINSSPKADAPFPPTYYPGVTRRAGANIVHVRQGEVRELEFALPEVAVPRPVHFVATDPDGKPLKTIYVQLEDLRHPGDAFSNVNVDLNAQGAGTLNVYAGYSYHLHASHWVKTGTYWCAAPVTIAAGTAPVQTRFQLKQVSDYCSLPDIDKQLRR